jgi:alpha-tubulin suppressor-like RCC1 family protein
MLARPKSDTRDFVCETGFSPLSRSRHAGFYKVLSEIKPGGFMKHLKWLLVSVFAVSLLGACNTSLPETTPGNTVTNRAPTVTDVSITASKVAMRESDSSLLTATVTGNSVLNTDVTWAIEAGGVGSLSSNTGNVVKYYAPNSSFGRVVRITATSVQDPTKARTIFFSVNPVKASIAGGGNHTLALRSDGQVLSWGNNDYGQLGDGTTINQAIPVKVQAKNDIVAVAAGYYHSLALKSDGTVLSWGFPNGGIPVVVNGASKTIAISAGFAHSMALQSDGTVLSWGYNFYGQVGDGTTVDQPNPVIVVGAKNIVSIAAGGLHSLALKSDGTVLSWGYNGTGQLGDGTITDQNIPVTVAKTDNVISIAAGTYHNLAIKSDGTLVSWGDNGSLMPVPVGGASNIIAIAAGYTDYFALKSDGTMLSWGYNAFGQLGNGTQSWGLSPAPVPGASKIVAISAGFYHSVALRSNGKMLSWGNDSSGQLGNDVVLADQSTPVSVLLGSNTIRLP